MKKIVTASFFVVLLAALVSVTSCNKEDLIVPFNLGDQTFCVAANPNQAYQVYTFSIDHDDVLAALNAAGVTDVGRVKKAALKSGFKAVISATGIATNLNELVGVEVYMKETGTGGGGTQIAYSETIGADATEVLLLVNGAEMKDAVTKDLTFTVKILNKPSGNSNQICVTLKEGIIDVSVRK